MARGHRGHSHSHHHGRGGNRNAGAIFQASIDNMINYPAPPTLINGIYTFVGNEMSLRAQVDGGITPLPQAMPQINLAQMNMMPPMMPPADMMMQEALLGGMPPMIPGGIPMQSMMAPQGNELSIQQANIMIVGTKSKPGNDWCHAFTVIFGSLLIFPLFFMCCMWWKKIVYPTYDLTMDAYQNLANFLSRAQNVNNLNLTVVDNSFGSQKARIIHDTLARSRITGFTFNNRALNCNGQHNEADDFRTNMAGIKSLNMSTSMTWGDMIV